MAKYSPVAHSTPHTSTVDGTTVRGQGPGAVYTQLTEGHGVPPIVWVATRLDSDGQPTGMVAVSTAGAGTVG
jgi:hypothetical protein